MRRMRLGITLLGLLLAGACESSTPAAPSEPQVQTSGAPIPPVDATEPVDLPGLHNVVTYHDGYISGGVPEGEAGLDTLAAMGVKTIISVDGTIPDVKAAAARGMRYIHLPFSYNGFDKTRRDQLVRASRDAIEEGPVYVHCHHGKHRSASAAGTVAVSMGWMSNDAAVARMKVSGTSPNYKGLYACTADAEVMDHAEIDAVPANFVSVWKPSDFVASMVEIDAVHDHLKAIQKSGWQVPADHPDLVPVAEAGRMVDLYRIGHQTEYTEARPEDFAKRMKQAEDEAQALEDLLGQPSPDRAKLDATFGLVNASCTSCHKQYRDQ